MVWYFAFVLFTHAAAVLFYYKIKKVNLLSGIFMYVMAASLLMSVIFPYLIVWLTIFQTSILYLGVAFLAGMYFTRLDGIKAVTVNQEEKKEFNEDFLQPESEEEKELENNNELAEEDELVEESELVKDNEIEEVNEIEENKELILPTESKEDVDVNYYDEELISPEKSFVFLQVKGDNTMVNSKEAKKKLNSYIDQGFEAKARGDLEAAVDCFTKALELSPSNDMMTFLVLDISTMYKELGRYNEARGILETFIETFGNILNDNIRRDIKANIEYLFILSELLIKANTPNLPLGLVPAIIKLGADEKLAKRANLIELL